MSRILVVDDVEGVRSVVRRFLVRSGHEVAEAEDGDSAMRALDQAAFDLVVTDIHMPDMDGVELILAMMDRWPRVPIIAMSGGGLLPKDLLLDTARALGVVATLSKPLDLVALRDAVQAALAERGKVEG